MRLVLLLPGVLALTGALTAQAPGRWPPDSLLNTQVFPRNTPVTQVVGAMRNITFALGVRCQFCHVGEEGMPLERFDFAKDEKRTKLVARQMLRMVQEINRRVDTLPGRSNPGLEVTCATCHRGVTRPVPLPVLLTEAGQAGGADSAIRTYRALRAAYYGGDAYDFREPALSIAAFRLGRASRFDAAFPLLRLNEELFPGSSAMYVFRGNIELMRSDTAAAAAAFREAVRRDSSNAEARGRLRAIGREPAPPAQASPARDTVRLEVGSPAVKGTFYPEHRGITTSLRIEAGRTDTAGRWLNVLVIGDSAGIPVHRWHTGGTTRGPDGRPVRFDLWQTFDARTLALYGYHLQSGSGNLLRLTIDGRRVRGIHRPRADAPERAVDLTLPRAGFVAGAVDLIPQAVGLREGLVLTIPVWSPPADSVVTQVWAVRRRTTVEFEGRQVPGWEMEHYSTGGQRQGTIWLIDEPPYMARWDVATGGGRITRYLGERGTP